MAADIVTTFKIYVGNVPENTDDDDVKAIFEEFGTVVQCTCVGRKAFVHMEDDIEGKHAVGELQGRELNGNVLTIQEARNNESPRIPTVKLLVKNISSTVDARGLRNMFKRFGYVLEVQVENGEGHVCLEAIGDIRSAITEMNGYKIEDMELSVEPAPIPAEDTSAEMDTSMPAASMSPSKSFKKNEKEYNWDSAWHRAKGEYKKSKQQYGGGDSYDYSGGRGSYGHNPWIAPQPHFNPQPERILRDPYLRPRQPHFANAHSGGRGFRGGHMMMGPRGPPPGMLPPPPQFPGLPPIRGMPERIMRSGFQPRGAPNFRNNTARLEHVPCNAFAQEEYVNDYEEEQVFYEDEPISSVARSKYQSKMSLTGANSIPVGAMGGPGPARQNFPHFPQQRNGNGNARGGGAGRRGGGRGRGKPQRFTAMTEEVGPGEKYPVPPADNPNFRAPMKRPKEEVKRKVKRKKKPLIPAELPDYSVPVPQLPQQCVPRGAVLTAFPPPQGHSVIDFDTFGGGGSASFFDQKNNEETSSSSMDFTTDVVV